MSFSSFYLGRRWGWSLRFKARESQVWSGASFLFICQHHPIWGMGEQVPNCWSISPQCHVWAGSVSSKFVLSTLPVLPPLPRREQSWSKEGSEWMLRMYQACTWAILATIKLRLLLISYPPPYVKAMPVPTWFCFLQLWTFLNCSSLHLSGELHCRERWPGAGAQLWLRCMLGGHRKPTRVLGSFLHLVSGIRKHVHALHEWSLGFLLLPCQSHWFSNQLRELDFLVLDPRAGVPHL